MLMNKKKNSCRGGVNNPVKSMNYIKFAFLFLIFSSMGLKVFAEPIKTARRQKNAIKSVTNDEDEKRDSKRRSR